MDQKIKYLAWVVRSNGEKNNYMISNPISNAVRFLSADAVQKAKSGHPGAPMGMADIANVLWRKYLKQGVEDWQVAFGRRLHVGPWSSLRGSVVLDPHGANTL